MGGAYLEEINDYLSDAGVRIANLSLGNWTHQLAAEQDADYLARLLDRTRRFHASRDPNVLYVLSAGNEAQDLDLASNELTGPVSHNGPDGTPLWRFPQSITPRVGLVVAASNHADTFAERWLGCEGTDPTDPATWPICLDLPGVATVNLPIGELPKFGSNRRVKTGLGPPHAQPRSLSTWFASPTSCSTFPPPAQLGVPTG